MVPHVGISRCELLGFRFLTLVIEITALVLCLSLRYSAEKIASYFCQGRATRRLIPASHDRGSPARGTSRSLAACSFLCCKRTIIVRSLYTARVQPLLHSVLRYIWHVSTLTWPPKEGWMACFSRQNSAHRPEVPCGYHFRFLTSPAGVRKLVRSIRRT